MRRASPLALLLLSAALGVSSAALASVPRSGSATLAPDAPELGLAPLERALASDERPRFPLGLEVLDAPPQRLAPLAGVRLLDEDLAAQLARTGDGEEPSYPKTRIGGLRAFGQHLIVVSTPVSVDVHWGCADFDCEIAEGIGEWLSEDPAGTLDSPSLYAFVGNRPNLATDPTGLCLGLDEIPCSEYVKEFGDQFLFANLGATAKRSGRFLVGEARGAVKAVPNLVQGVAQVAAHPVRTIQALGTAAGEAIADPRGTARRAGTALLNADPDRAAEFAGETLALVGLGTVAKTTEGAAALGRLKNAVSFDGLTEAAGGGVFDYSAEVARASRAAGSVASKPPLQLFEDVVKRQASRLAADPGLARTVLSDAEYAAGQASEKMARLQYGNALERLAAGEVEATPHLEAMFRHVGGPRRADFVGRIGSDAIGMRFEITTEAARAAHVARPYGPGLKIVTYARPPGFTLFPQ